jgi:hypothetical protein
MNAAVHSMSINVTYTTGKTTSALVFSDQACIVRIFDRIFHQIQHHTLDPPGPSKN